MTAPRIEEMRLYTYELPLVRPLLLAGAAHTARKGLLLEATAEDGRTGWGDAAPLPGFSRETLDEVIAQARRMTGNRYHSERLLPSLSFALETARAGCAQQTFSQPFFVNGLLAGTDSEIRSRAGALVQAGYQTLKIKVGRQAPEQALELLGEIGRIAGPQVQIRIDANRAWSIEEGVRFAVGLRDKPYEYIEEPLREPGRLPELVERTGARVALDEKLAELEPSQVERHTYASALVLKPTILGPERTAAFIQEAKKIGLSVTLSAAFESGIGIRALAALASRLGLTGTAHGLDTYSWLAEDVLEPRLSMEGGLLDLAAPADGPPRIRRELLTEVK